MSRTMQQPSEKPAESAGGTPIWVWAIYALGILAAAILAFSLLFTAGAFILSDDVAVTFEISTIPLVLWSGLCLLAGGLWIYRRRR